MRAVVWMRRRERRAARYTILDPAGHPFAVVADVDAGRDGRAAARRYRRDLGLQGWRIRIEQAYDVRAVWGDRCGCDLPGPVIREGANGARWREAAGPCPDPLPVALWSAEGGFRADPVPGVPATQP